VAPLGWRAAPFVVVFVSVVCLSGFQIFPACVLGACVRRGGDRRGAGVVDGGAVTDAGEGVADAGQRAPSAAGRSRVPGFRRERLGTEGNGCVTRRRPGQHSPRGYPGRQLNWQFRQCQEGRKEGILHPVPALGLKTEKIIAKIA